MTFPDENEWIILTEKEYWSGNNLWEDWTGDATMYAKYNFIDDELHMSVKLNLDEAEEPADYIWDFIKIDDSVDPWF